jgi:hypothetical protein
MGNLYYAPAGTDLNWGGEWISLGSTDEPCIQEMHDGEAGAEIGLSFTQSFAGTCVSLSLSVERMSAASCWLLFRQRHPRLSRIRRAYRRRSRQRH